MLETLQERLARVTKTLRGEGHLTEYHVETALREIRLALLEADVSVEVVTRFIDRVRQRAVGQEVLNSVTPAQLVTKIVNAKVHTGRIERALLEEAQPSHFCIQPQKTMKVRPHDAERASE